LVICTVHEPPNPPGDPADRALRLVFIKDGFLWLAAIFPAIWLLVKGLWLEFVIFVAAVGLLTWGLEAMGATSMASGMLLLIVQIVFGLEASNIYAAALDRRGWRMVGTATGRNRAECERRFLEEWLASPSESGMTPPLGPVSALLADARSRAMETLERWRRHIAAKA
jgi:hypothetical protein